MKEAMVSTGQSTMAYLPDISWDLFKRMGHSNRDCGNVDGAEGPIELSSQDFACLVLNRFCDLF